MDGPQIRDFNDLIVWQKSMELAQKVYVVTQTFPKLEVFGLVAQLRRSAVSAPKYCRRKWQTDYERLCFVPVHRQRLARGAQNSTDVGTQAWRSA